MVLNQISEGIGSNPGADSDHLAPLKGCFPKNRAKAESIVGEENSLIMETEKRPSVLDWERHCGMVEEVRET